MRRLLASLALSLCVIAAPASAADGTAVSIRDPGKFASLLKELGYSPEPIRKVGKLPIFTVSIANQPTNIVFGGCTDFLDCRYIVMSSSYTDVLNPPADWLVQMNDNFDVLKIGIDSEKALYFSATHIIEGIPRTTLREILEAWDRDATALAEEAVKAKLDKK